MSAKMETELSEHDRVVKKHLCYAELEWPQARVGSSITVNPLCGLPLPFFHDGRDFDTLFRKKKL
jgi:hypothetical protein